MPLLPCKVCRRHVRPSDGKCPFCGTLAAAALAIGLAFFSACGGKTATASGPGDQGRPVDARVADVADATPVVGVDADLGPRAEPAYGVAGPELPRDQPLYGVPIDD